MNMIQSTALDFSLTEHEGELLSVFLQPEAELTTLIPQSPEDLDMAWDQLSVCLKTMEYAEKVTAMLKPVVGRFLKVAKDNPEFYLRKGFPTYEKFMTNYVGSAMNIGRSVLYDCRLIAENLPDLSPQEYYTLGSTKARDLARFSKSDDPSFSKYLKEAHDRTSSEFRKYCEEQKLIEAGEVVPVVIVIQANEKVAKMWNEFVADPAVHSKVGTSNHGTILEHLIMEGYFWTVPERT